ncbi:tyrosine-protein phosphatase [Propionimicrobium sp. PCR01-08-3]|uniref:tyrosine-protein phosphatase n=1 Tax=Propionimicrobium sp. PCR01-08-3 TaxID=3052086 RepID=UPI00255CA4D8|nr:tyrosine-protein phosphatase [Propionimicrobium sp. PCR01-08-3]WIY83075.1 tyrosine-protein phosphatase [Propionimicrobium sp. PCR01-08-3]
MDRRIALATAPNMRDLGGLPVDGGTVRPRQIYRSATLANLSDEDLAAFERLGVRTIYDMRTAVERAAAPDTVPAHITQIALDVLADSAIGLASQTAEISQNPTVILDLLDSPDAAQTMMRSEYRDFVSLTSAQRSYRTFFESLADPKRTGTALVHCTTGKDRTGWASAAFLLLLGADEQTVRDDYLQTNADLLPALQPLVDMAAAQGIEPEMILPILGVRDSYLDAALDQVAIEFGTVEDYFINGLGLGTAMLDALRLRFVD